MTQYLLPPLPYTQDALEPYISAKTLEYHYGKHHRNYVNQLNTILINGNHPQVDTSSLPSLINTAGPGALFNNAAQVWNHSFYWDCLSPTKTEPPAELLSLFVRDFGGIEAFKEQFLLQSSKLFGSGWCWLVADKAEKLSIITTSNANSPLTENLKPLLTCDVWEHAYYIDYHNNRLKYLQNFFSLINWNFVYSNLTNASIIEYSTQT